MPKLSKAERAEISRRNLEAFRARKAEAAAEAAKEAMDPSEPVAVMEPIIHEGEASPPVIEPEVEEDPLDAADDFERFLAAQDDETRAVLSHVELRVIYEIEVKRAADERKATVKKAAVARAMRHARASAGLISAELVEAQALRDKLARKVTWTVRMPEAGNSGTLIDEGVRINGTLYPHGTEMTGTLAEYISYREMEYRAFENERQMQGRSRMSRMAQSGMRFLNNEGYA